MMGTAWALRGAFYTSLSPEKVRYEDDALIEIGGDGVIRAVLTGKDEGFLASIARYEESGTLVSLSEREILLPGFIDLHNHAPQWPQAGTALDRPLEVWLNEYTFPLEAKYGDLEFAGKVYSRVVDTAMKHGTTSAVYFATVDREPSELLAEIAGEKGLRAFVGKVVMDDEDGNPGYYRDESTEKALLETERFIENVEAIGKRYKQKVYPVVTPRFIPSCTDEALIGLGEIARRHGAYIQTHCSESDWEHGFALSRYGMTDACSLDSFGLLTDRTILAHATFLTDEDVRLLSERGCTIAHSPISNAYFASSVLPLKSFRERGVNIGLATDVSGGWSPSMYTAIRQAVISSRMLSEGVDPSLPKESRGRRGSAITLNEAFYAATAAGGDALGLKIGRIEPGYAFDAQLIDLYENIPLFMAEKKDEDLLHKILLLSESSNIKRVWVQGEIVK